MNVVNKITGLFDDFLDKKKDKQSHILSEVSEILDLGRDVPDAYGHALKNLIYNIGEDLKFTDMSKKIGKDTVSISLRMITYVEQIREIAQLFDENTSKKRIELFFVEDEIKRNQKKYGLPGTIRFDKSEIDNELIITASNVVKNSTPKVFSSKFGESNIKSVCDKYGGKCHIELSDNNYSIRIEVPLD